MALIYLVGARGSGKTTVGSLLAENLKCAFEDLDQSLCARERRSVAEIVAQEGWPRFRELETEVLREVSTRHARSGHAVLATGGGIVLAAPNREFLRGHGHVIWLKSDASLLAGRLAANPENGQRPALTNHGLIGEVEQILSERTPLYQACAHKIVDCAAAPCAIAARIATYLREAEILAP